MISLILRTISRYHLPLLLLFSFFLFLRGHNEPGGGFISGLVASSSLALYTLAYNPAGARRVLRIEPRLLIAIGLMLALGSGGIGLIGDRPFLTGTWLVLRLPGGDEVHMGTPLLFDLGVYVLVVGATLTIIIAMAEE
jgi:multicomponent Na+:H+ antiporter subunit B